MFTSEREGMEILAISKIACTNISFLMLFSEDVSHATYNSLRACFLSGLKLALVN